jgi:hypothetical protein
MDFLEDTFGANTSPVELTDLVGTDLPTMNPPIAAMRNRAASTAMANSAPEEVVQNYQLMMNEAESGSSNIVDTLNAKGTEAGKDADLKGLLSVLGDKNLTLEQKQEAVKAMKNSMFLKDTGARIHSNALAAPSEGETLDNENARLSSADAIEEVYQARADIQGIVNAHGASLDSTSASTFLGAATLIVAPFMNAVDAGRLNMQIANAEGDKLSAWDTVKGFILSGSTIADRRAALENLPPAERVKYARHVIDAIQSNKGIIFGNDNQFAEFQRAVNIFEEDGYTSFDKWVDNLSPILDIIGLGQLGRSERAVKAVTKGAGVVDVVASDVAPIVKAPRASIGITEGDLATTTGKPTTGAYNASIEALQAEKATLLGDAGNILDKGQVAKLKAEKAAIEKPRTVAKIAAEIQARNGVTSKAAKKEAVKINADEVANYEGKVSRIDSQLESNAKASTVSQRIDILDKQIEQLTRNNTPIYLKKTPLSDFISRLEMNSVVRIENPAAPANILQSANPQLSRNAFTSVFKSEGDEVANALYGTSKTQAIVNNVFPQVATESGSVLAKTTDIQRILRTVPDEMRDASNLAAGSYFDPKELVQARAKIVNDFSSAEGLRPNDAMSSFAIDGNRIKISALYGTPEGSFSSAEDAAKQAEFALRHHGIRPDEITVMKKQGLDYVPVKLADEAGKTGDYMVRVDTFHEVDPTDITNYVNLDVKKNWLDRVAPLVSQNKGSVSRYLFDAASMLHPIITGAASNVSDVTAKFDKFLLGIASEFSDGYVKLPAARKAAIDDYIREANFKGIKFDPVDLALNRGFDNKEIDILSKWRRFWDGHFYLENADIVRTLNSQGFELFKNNNTELYAKAISKNQNIGWFYDPAIDDVVRHGKGEGDILYAAGGTYARLRRPISVNGVEVEHMIVRNTPTEYTRKFRDTDQVLNYRDGYFQIQYKAPKFVIDADAKRAVAIAGDTAEAKFFAERMTKANGKKYEFRGDIRELQRGSDAWWDVNSASGRIAQRHRGQLLEDASGLNHLGDGSYILDPVESAVRAAKSIAGRTVSRPMLESAKARFISQYGEFLQTDEYGRKAWPRSIDGISSPGKETSKAVADARTTYEYINYLENGYINSMDQVFKWTLNGIANGLGSLGMAKAERGALWLGEHSPTGWGKNAVFMAYIGTNPLRQWIIQPHQALRTIAYNPKAWFSGRLTSLSTGFIHNKITGKYLSTEAKDFTEFVNGSGMLDAVDKSNLVRGTLLEAANNTGNIAVRAAKGVTDTARKVGFDLGEQTNLLMHMSAVYDKRIRMGQNLKDKNLAADAYSEIRAISYDMNFAGDLPYNQTSPSMILQFMQVPHKAFLQMTNRRIDVGSRLRMAAGDMILWGGPTALIYNMVGKDFLPDNPVMRETIVWGLESAMLNKTLSWMADERTNVDFSSLAPYEMTGWTKFFEAMYSGGVEQMIANSPAGQLLLKDGGRVRNAVGAMSRFFGIVEDMDEDPETFTSVMNDVLKISSGYSNGVKAMLLLNAKKRLDQYGNKIDSDVTSIEAYSQFLGFGSADTRDLYRTAIEWSKDTKAHRDDVLQVYQSIKRYYAEHLEVETSDPKYITKVTGQIMKVFEKDPLALAIIRSEWSKDMVGKDQALMALFMKRIQIPNIGNLIDEVKTSSLTPEQKDEMLKMIKNVSDARVQSEGQ